MRIFIWTIFATICVSASGQIVDIESASEGMAPPRVSLASALTCTATQEGSIVYQTNSPEGLYTCDGTTWQMVGGSGGTVSAYKEITATQTIAASASNLSLGFDLAAPETGTYLILVNIQGIRTDGFVTAMEFKTSINDVTQSAATRTVTFNTGFREPIALMHSMVLTAGQVVDVEVTNPVAVAADVANRNMILLKL